MISFDMYWSKVTRLELNSWRLFEVMKSKRVSSREYVADAWFWKYGLVRGTRIFVHRGVFTSISRIICQMTNQNRWKWNVPVYFWQEFFSRFTINKLLSNLPVKYAKLIKKCRNYRVWCLLSSSCSCAVSWCCFVLEIRSYNFNPTFSKPQSK